jgi:hypothetical protein
MLVNGSGDPSYLWSISQDLDNYYHGVPIDESIYSVGMGRGTANGATLQTAASAQQAAAVQAAAASAAPVAPASAGVTATMTTSSAPTSTSEYLTNIPGTSLVGFRRPEHLRAGALQSNFGNEYMKSDESALQGLLGK